MDLGSKGSDRLRVAPRRRASRPIPFFLLRARENHVCPRRPVRAGFHQPKRTKTGNELESRFPADQRVGR